MKLYFDKIKQEWRKPLDENEDKDSIYLDGYLKDKLDAVNKLKEKNWDCVFLVVGNEGSGKSTLAFTCGQYLSNMGLTMDNIAEGTKDALEKLERLPNKSILIVDEGELLFSSRETMSREQRQLTQIMKVIRQKNMIFILVSPVFFDLSKYICIDRSKFLLRTVVDKEFNRGHWQYWGSIGKKLLYLTGKKHFGSYSKPKPKLYGRFVDYKLPFHDEYLKLKQRSLKEAFDGKKTDEKVTKNVDFAIISLHNSHPELTTEEIAIKVGRSAELVRQKIRFYNIIQQNMANSLGK